MSMKPAASSLVLVGLAVAVVGVLVYLVGGELKRFLDEPAAESGGRPSAPSDVADVAPPPPAKRSPEAGLDAARSAPGAIRGLVRGDDGEPLPGATVTALPTEGRDGTSTVATTGADGRFALNAPADGASLRIAAPGLVTVTEMRVIPGREIEIRLEKGGSIDGSIRSVEGGGAIPGATVTATARAGGSLAFSDSSTTDTNGHFSFPAVPGRPVNLRVDATGFEPLEDRGIRVVKGQAVTRDLSLRPGLKVRGTVVDGDTRKPVEGAVVAYGLQNISGKREVTTDATGSFTIPGIARGQQLFVIRADGYSETRKSLPLEDDPTIVLEIFKGRTLRGRVEDRSGSPIAEALVFVGREGVFVGPRSKPSASTDRDGRFTVPDLPAGQTYRLIVRHDGHPETISPEIALTADTAEIVVVMGPGGSIGGTVRDAAGQPIEGAKITVVDAFNPDPLDPQGLLPTFGGTGRGTAETGHDGRYVVENLSPGKKRVSAGADAFLPSRIEEATVVESPTPTVLDFVLDRGKSISGRVTDPLGKPVEGAKVNASANQPEVSGFGSATTEADGAYRVERLADGAFNVSVRKPGFTVEYKKDVPSGTDGVDFSLRRNGGIAGSVTDFATGKPVRQFMVRLSETVPSEVPANKAKAFTSDEGSFLLDEVRPGSFRVEVTAKGFAPGIVEDIVVNEGATTEGIRVALKEGGVVEGTVLDLAGSPIPRATVFARLILDEPVGGGRMPVTSSSSATTDEDGRYRISGLLSDDYEIYASAPAYSLSARERVRAEDGRVSRIDFRLSMGATLLVVVLGTDGTPVKDARVEIRDERDEPVYNERIRQVIERYRQDPDQLESFLSRLDRSDRNGQVRFTNFPPGEYRLFVSSGPGSDVVKRVTLRDKDDVREEVVVAGQR